MSDESEEQPQAKTEDPPVAETQPPEGEPQGTEEAAHEVSAATGPDEDRPAAAKPAPKGNGKGSKRGGAQTPEQNLAALEALAGDLERLSGLSDLKLKTAEKKLQQADSRYPNLLVLPGAQKRKAIERFQEARRQLFIKLGELREAEDWKRWANVPVQEELIKRAQTLAADVDSGVIQMSNKLKEVQAAWKDVGPAPHEKAQDLWQRFKEACDVIYDRIKELRATQSVEHKENLRRKQELCVRAEELADSTDWQVAAEAFKRLQNEWKAIGPVPRKQADEVWTRFRAACDRFFDRRRPHLERAIGERQANIEQKESLVVRAEELARGDDDADWEAATREVSDLRRDWKRSGQIPHREFEALSKRFGEACDYVFSRRDEARENLVLKQRASVSEPYEAATALLDAQAGGQEIDTGDLVGQVVRARAALREWESNAGRTDAELADRVIALCARAVEAAPTAFKGTDLDPTSSQKRKEKLLSKAEALAERAMPKAALEAVTAADMAAKLRAALADRALGGVLAKDTKPVKQQFAELRDAWRKLGPVPGDEGRALEARFEAAWKSAK